MQYRYVRSIRGLEEAEILQAGYAVEYDHVDPTELDRRYAVVSVPGLFLAGQINGTTGYEEAAAQGITAGINAALEILGKAPCVFGREQGYIGVLRGRPEYSWCGRALQNVHLPCGIQIAPARGQR